MKTTPACHAFTRIVCLPLLLDTAVHSRQLQDVGDEFLSVVRAVIYFKTFAGSNYAVCNECGRRLIGYALRQPRIASVAKARPQRHLVM
jgi:hypothetical protein